jgi:hypothetical protein
MGKIFQNTSSLKPLGQFSMLIGNPRLPPLQEIDKHWTLWENVQMPSSQKLQIRLNPN